MKIVCTKAFFVYIIVIYINESERSGMKIHIEDKSDNGEVFVKGLYGPKTIKYILSQLQKSIEETNNALRLVKEAYGENHGSC